MTSRLSVIAAIFLMVAILSHASRSDAHGSKHSDLVALVSHASSPVIWMGGSAGPDHDYPRLLTDYRTALVQAGVRVLKVYTADLVYGNEAEIRRIIEYCHDNGLKLAAEGYLVSAFSAAEVSEGESPPGEIERLVRRMRRLGGELDYFESDETLFKAHTVYKHPIHDVAANAAHNAQILRDAFPNIRLADIEPFPQDMIELRSFLQAFAEESHRPFEIYNPDVAWNSEYGRTTWLKQLGDLSRLVGAMHMQLAVIYNGNDRNATDSVKWATLAEQRLAMVESDPSITVDDAILQTWDKFPTKLGPATEPGTMLNLTTVYSSLARLYRSGYLKTYPASSARIHAPDSLTLAPPGRASLAAVRIGASDGSSVERRVAVVLIATGGTFNGAGPSLMPILAGAPNIAALAGTISDVNLALHRLTISGINAEAALEIEVFGPRGNLDRKAVQLVR